MFFQRSRSRKASSCSHALGVGLASSVVAAMVATGITGGVQTASADSVGSTLPTPVAADLMRSPQHNGISWTQAIAGDIVYVGGEFTAGRPSGVPAGGAGEVPRTNVLAFNIKTGKLLNWAPKLNGIVRAMTVTPDGSKLIVGGAFTSVDGTTRPRIAVFNARTGALLTHYLSIEAQVLSVAATNDVVYVGGNFNRAGGASRTRLAAFDLNTGRLTSWAPTIDNQPLGMAVSPDGSKIVIGGRFRVVNGEKSWGSAMLDTRTGQNLPWAIDEIAPVSGANSAIFGVSGDADHAYLVGYHFGGDVRVNFEGVLAARWSDGEMEWILDCRGDSYATAPANGLVYIASHEHDCSSVDELPQTRPWQYTRATVVTSKPSPYGRLNKGHDFAGKVAPEMLHWHPDIAYGNFTNTFQGAWTVSANDDYVVYGGEFPSVNRTPQQGIAVFARRGIAPGKESPRGGQDMDLELAEVNGTVRATFNAVWDRDNRNLSYTLVRDGRGIATVTADSAFFNRPSIGINDPSPTSGTHTYSILVTDPDGNGLSSSKKTITTTLSRDASSYVQVVNADTPAHHWRLNVTSDTVGYDSAGVNDLKTENLTEPIDGAISDGDPAMRQRKEWWSWDPTAQTDDQNWAPQTYSSEIWFRTSSDKGGALLGFGNKSSEFDSQKDRLVYVSQDGKVNYALFPGEVKHIASPKSYNDGQWHHVVTTLGADGMSLYVDGSRVAHDASVPGGEGFKGYWKISSIGTSGFPNDPGRSYFDGDLDEAAIYHKQLSAASVDAHYRAGKALDQNETPTASFSATPTNLDIAVDGSGSTDADGTITDYTWDFGDGSTGTGVTATHSYADAGTYTVTLTVTDDKGSTNTTSQQITVSAVNQPPTAEFTSTTTELDLSVDATASADADGSIDKYEWDFGDGSTGTGVTATHKYADAGTYTVTLTVTDNQGATTTKTESVTITPGNQPPVAGFTAAISGLSATLDGSTSTDDGTIVKYEWDFGDGTNGTGQSVTHTYPSAGTYIVGLTVTDNAGATSKILQSVTVKDGVDLEEQVIAEDNFQRTETNGFGSAQIGGEWQSLFGGTPSRFSTDGELAKIQTLNTQSTRTIALPSAVTESADIVTDLTLDKAAEGGPNYAGVILRQTADENQYRARIRYETDGSLRIVLDSVSGWTSTWLASSKLGFINYQPGMKLKLRAQVHKSENGSTVLRAKVWPADQPEIADWRVTATDKTAALQQPGFVGLQTYSSWRSTAVPFAVTVDEFRATTVKD